MSTPASQVEWEVVGDGELSDAAIAALASLLIEIDDQMEAEVAEA